LTCCSSWKRCFRCCCWCWCCWFTFAFCCDFRSWIHPAWVAVGNDPIHRHCPPDRWPREGLAPGRTAERRLRDQGSSSWGDLCRSSGSNPDVAETSSVHRQDRELPIFWFYLQKSRLFLIDFE
jgi:hypothetical protein